MWYLYCVMSFLTAGIVLKLTGPLLGRGRHKGPDAPARRDRQLAALLTCAVPLLALVIYLVTGHPELPGSPALFHDPMQIVERQEALLSKKPFETLLRQNPDDLSSVIKLAAINRKLGRFGEAVKFMQRGVMLAKRQDDMYLRLYAEDLGRLQVLANGGRIGKDAVDTFNYVLTLSRKDPIARFYLALGRAQGGDTDAAIEEWTDMLSEGATGAYWKDSVRQALAAAKEGKIAETPLNMP
jgi:cytochrome c-type biogenesis protein CcmH